MDGLAVPWLSFSAATGGWTLAGFAVFCVIAGWLNPRWVLALLIKRSEAQDVRIAAQDETIKELTKQNAALTEALKISNDAMSALKKLAESGGRT